VLVLLVERWGLSDLGVALDPTVALVAIVRSPLGAAGVVALYSILLSEAIWVVYWLASLRERSASRSGGERRV